MNFNEPSVFNTVKGNLAIIRLMGKGKSGYSYLALDPEENKNYILKLMHDEPCPYYNFEKNKVTLEYEAYKILKQAGIPLPELIEADINRNFILKEYIEGEVATKIIAAGSITENIIKQLFEISSKAENNLINLDYFPANFVINDETLYYIDYECNHYTAEWNLNNWGIWYWANEEGFQKFIETGDAAYINESQEKGLPHKKPFEKKVNAWKLKFSHQD